MTILLLNSKFADDERFFCLAQMILLTSQLFRIRKNTFANVNWKLGKIFVSCQKMLSLSLGLTITLKTHFKIMAGTFSGIIWKKDEGEKKEYKTKGFQVLRENFCFPLENSHLWRHRSFSAVEIIFFRLNKKFLGFVFSVNLCLFSSFFFFG